MAGKPTRNEYCYNEVIRDEVMQGVSSYGIEHKDFGIFSIEQSDYPEVAKAVAKEVAAGNYDRGILICGTGVGISIAANKVNGIRACCCSEPFSAKLSKQHNNSNVLCFGARVVGEELAKMIVSEWLNAEYLGGRHQIRVDMIADIENRQ